MQILLSESRDMACFGAASDSADFEIDPQGDTQPCSCAKCMYLRMSERRR